MNRNKLQILLISAMLCAIGIIIPMFSPLKVVLEPASFTLGSHIAIFIAMFVSPVCALAVAFGTTVGFFLGGFPLVVVMRAATHIVFAGVGSVVLAKRPETLEKPVAASLFALLISVFHAISEVAIVMHFYFGNRMSGAYYSKGFFTSVILLVGVGTVIHSLVDFSIARIVWAPIKKMNMAKTRTVRVG